MDLVVGLPALSLLATVKVKVPFVDVRILAPSGTVPEQVATPDVASRQEYEARRFSLSA